jgi:hypothetical protein
MSDVVGGRRGSGVVSDRKDRIEVGKKYQIENDFMGRHM